jgi:hypothetical protein
MNPPFRSTNARRSTPYVERWRKVLDGYPGIDLEREAYKQADWLRRNHKRNCNAARYTNWLDKAHPNVTPIRAAVSRDAAYAAAEAKFGYLAGKTA